MKEPIHINYIDLFCGIGGFRYGVQQALNTLKFSHNCVFSSDIDPYCQSSYLKNFKDEVHGDISKIDATEIPDHDLLVGGFPCQPFSIIGKMNGFKDTRGTLFFDIARILEEKMPSMFVLENVKLLVGHDKGNTLQTILQVLRELGYYVDYKVLNALDFGLPQKRERIWIVGSLKPFQMNWPLGGIPMKPLSKLLESNVDKKHYASEYIQKKRLEKLSPTKELTIWHENKAGNVSSYPYSCALRAGASYNYLLVNGSRRLTPREMLRLQGIPDNFKITCSDAQTRKQAGNCLPVNVAKEVIISLIESTIQSENSSNQRPQSKSSANKQLLLCEEESPYTVKK